MEGVQLSDFYYNRTFMSNVTVRHGLFHISRSIHRMLAEDTIPM